MERRRSGQKDPGATRPSECSFHVLPASVWLLFRHSSRDMHLSIGGFSTDLMCKCEREWLFISTCYLCSELVTIQGVPCWERLRFRDKASKMNQMGNIQFSNSVITAPTCNQRQELSLSISFNPFCFSLAEIHNQIKILNFLSIRVEKDKHRHFYQNNTFKLFVHWCFLNALYIFLYVCVCM